MGDQVIAPPSMPASAPVEAPSWNAGPEAPAVPDASRPDEVAEVLRSALAQGHSDEALAGLLRKVLNGASPQVALPEPVLPEPAVAEPVFPELVMADNVVAEPPAAEAAPVAPEVPQYVAPQPVQEAPAPAVVPLFEAAPPVVEPVARPLFEPRFEVAPAPRPMFEPLQIPKPPVDIWGTSTSAPLWGEPVLPARVVSNDAPIWAEVVRAETPVVEEVVVEEVVAEEVVAEEVVAESVVEPAVEPAPEPVEEILEDVVAEIEEPLQDDAQLEDTTEEPLAESVEEVVAETEVTLEEVAAESPVDESLVDELADAEEAVVEDVVAETEVEEIAQLEDVVEDAIEDAVEVIVDAEDDVEAEMLVADEQVAEEQEAVDEAPAAEAEIAPALARTASDPAPVGLPMSMSLDATTVMPPLSLLPPLPSSRGRGRPPVPPVISRPSANRSRPAEGETADAAPIEPSLRKTLESLATVTRLPVAPLMAGPAFPEISEEEIERLAPEIEAPEFAFAVPVTEPAAEPTPAADVELPTGDIVDRLAALGLPTRFLGAGFAADVETLGTYSALTRALGLRLPAAPQLPSGPGDVLFVVGPGVEALRAARSLAASLRLDPDRVQWASRGDLAGLAPAGSRMTTVDAATARRQEAATAGTVTIVAVDTPRRSDQFWMTQLLDIWSPVAVWAVVEATRKPEDVGPWLDDLARVDALIVTDTDLSVDPAAVLHRVAAPVVLLDGVRATPHRWASLLCERLEGAQG